MEMLKSMNMANLSGVQLQQQHVNRPWRTLTCVLLVHDFILSSTQEKFYSARSVSKLYISRSHWTAQGAMGAGGGGGGNFNKGGFRGKRDN
eukprot:1677891-Pyramimonas_sp.AAC.2